VYVPGSRLWKLKEPEASVCTDVLLGESDTIAPEIGSPELELVTIPVIPPKLATSSSLHPHIKTIDMTDSKYLRILIY
jgi:hypothetical protein